MKREGEWKGERLTEGNNADSLEYTVVYGEEGCGEFPSIFFGYGKPLCYYGEQDDHHTDQC